MIKLPETLSDSQRKIAQALIDNPEGLLSEELAHITGVSNKSEAMNKRARYELRKVGLHLIIERQGRQSIWRFEKHLPRTEGTKQQNNE